MSLADICDVSYALLVEQLERWTVAERQVAATFIAAGAKKVKMPDPDELRRDFDRSLLAVVARRPTDQQIVLEALGVRRAG